ncbi:hypothetical protein S7711_06004 [Stachybotrys chartarum IBT 7711]|uniref:Uncharacterized protein n=1 Tax=Stachybotrys chartarum (strain CBS 109288 / IBT 7711) TaxID=1280523 RepID=A0A084B2T3_STACB|nr:hypothetical protein S7711_06004 [Stachybotrys chartarum IBT 7711]KFA45365.1 hypothetical protein S40293_09607 [Stachybotrys chartarum IBT 40293]KFA81451.1 hypothetical protein S40288_03321 [Stachybotrys chartarum IBT 40288]
MAKGSLRWATRWLAPSARGCEAFSPRMFSTTPSYAATRILFTPTSNPDLDAILKTIQEKIIFPAYLPEKQRRLVFGVTPEQRARLAQNPVTLELEGVEHRFPPLNHSTDIPDSRKIFKEALVNMKSREDWANLVTLLSGYKKAGIKLSQNHIAKAVRLASRSGNIYAIIECATHAAATGVVFIRPETITRTLAAVGNKIMQGNGDVEAAKQALRWTRVVLELTERQAQDVGYNQAKEFRNIIRGTTLFIRACHYKLLSQAGEATDKHRTDLTDDVAALRSMWREAIETNDFNTREIQAINPTSEGGWGGAIFTETLAMNIKGMQLAQELGIEGAEELSPVMEALTRLMNETIEWGRPGGKTWDELSNAVFDVVLEPAPKEETQTQEADTTAAGN